MNRFPIILQAFLVAVFLCGFPLFLAGVGFGYLLDLQVENQRQLAFKELDRGLSQLQPYAEPATFLQGVLRKLTRRARKAADPVQYLQARVARIERRYPDLFTFLLFDEKDRFVGTAPPGISKRLSEKVLGLLRAFYGVPRETPRPGESNILLEQDSILAAFIGSKQHETSLDKGLPWLKVSAKPRKTWFYYDFSERFALMASIHRRGYPEMLGLQLLTRSRSNSSLVFHLVQLGGGGVHGVRDDRRNGLAEQVAAQFEWTPENHFILGGHLFSIRMIDATHRLIASTPDREDSSRNRRLTVFFWASLLLFSLSVWAAYRFILGGTAVYVSIRWKLLSLFLISSGIPLLILGFTAVAYLNERRQALIQESWLQATETLRTFDGKVLNLERWCKRQIYAVLDTIKRPIDPELPRIRAGLEACYTQLDCQKIGLIHKTGRELVAVPDRASREQEYRFVCSIVLPMLSTFNEEELPLNKQSSSIEMELLMDSMGSRGKGQIFDDLLLKAGHLVPFDLAGSKWIQYIDLLKVSPTKADMVFVASWRLRNFIRLYLKRSLPRRPLEDGTRLLALVTDPKLQTRFPASPQREMIPARLNYHLFPGGKLSPGAWGLIRRNIRGPRIEYGTILHEKEQCLITLVPGTKLEETLLIAIRPLGPIDRRIRALGFNLIGFGVFSIGFTVFLGMLLARQFLRPIQDLSAGVEAVHHHRLEHRIPEQNPDEFGELAILFNRMLEGLEEVSVGKQVQERLFPKTRLDVGEYSVFGISRTCSELGGDFFDYAPLGPNGLFLLIGDVTGHGIPAALVMAMAKASLLAVSEGNPTPEVILETINRVIVTTMRKKLILPLTAMYVDADGHRISLYQCGHTYPLRRRLDGTCENLDIGGIPLGLRPRLSIQTTMVDLAPGERVIFSTDGLGESLVEPDVDGFDRFRCLIQEQPVLPLEEACVDLLDRHARLLAGKPQSDDFTILMLERRPVATVG